MLVGALNAEFPFGVLLITDDGSTEPIPPWINAEEQATASGSAVVMRVLHQQEGPVAVRVWSEEGNDLDVPVFDGEIDVTSGFLTVSDALSEQAVRIPVAVGAHRIEIFANSTSEASEIGVLLDRLNL